MKGVTLAQLHREIESLAELVLEMKRDLKKAADISRFKVTLPDGYKIVRDDDCRVTWSQR